jgi:tetratricopeptide (TPR) repeat protein
MDQEKRADVAASGVNIIGGQINVGGDLVGGDKHVYEPPVVTIPALHQLPPPPRDFTGRDKEIAELMATVERGGVTISGLQGLGGVGKTALVLKLAEQLTQRYPDGQLYLDLRGVSLNPLTAMQAMEHVIRAYHPIAKLPEDEAQLAGLYQSVLHGKRAMLVMDNAKDAEQIKPLIPPASCLLLATSRRRFTLPGLAAKNIDVLSPGDARQLLVRIAPRLDWEQTDHASELARLCGYLPQAIVPVGSVLATRSDLRPADFVRRLADARERLKLTETDASFSLSYDLLPAEQQKRFRALAVFPDTFDVEGAAAVWDVERDVAQDSLSELGLYSLVEFNCVSIRYRLHDLVHVFADTRLDSDERVTSQRHHATYYKEVANKANILYLQGGASLRDGLALFELEWMSVQAGLAWATALVNDDDEAARLCINYLDAVAHFHDLRLHPRERAHWLEAALQAARRLKDSAAVGAQLGNLGVVYHCLGEYRRAIQYHEQSLEISREIGDRTAEESALGNLGLEHRSLGDSRRAIEFHKQALEIAREIGDQRGEQSALGNLGVAYKSLGEYEQAIDYYQHASRIAQEIGDRRGEQNALGNLGVAYKSLGQFDVAIWHYQKALQIAQEIGDRRGEGNVQCSLGNVYHALGDNDRAIEYHQAHLAIAQAMGDRRGEGQALGNLGNVYDSLGEYRRAIQHHESNLLIARETGDRSGEGNAHWNVSLALEKIGKRSEAIVHAEEALTIYEQIESSYTEVVRMMLTEWRGQG